jgi:hypothetical protein
MTQTAFCRTSLRAPRVCWFGRWALGKSDRGGQDKTRKVRAVGRGSKGSNFRHGSNIANLEAHLATIANTLSPFSFRHPVSQQ